MNNTIFEQVISVRNQGGCFDVSHHWGALYISGKDSGDFLNNLLTIDVHSLSNLKGEKTFILTPKAGVLFQPWVFKIDQQFLIIVNHQVDELATYFKKRIFLEQATVDTHIGTKIYFEKNINSEFYSQTIGGEESSLTNLKTLLDNLEKHMVIHHHSTWIIRLDCSGNPGYLWISTPPTQAKYICSSWDIPTLNILVFEGGHYIIGEDLPKEINVLKLNNDQKMINDNKGCYPGQEIIARSRSRNQSAVQKIVGLIVESLESSSSLEPSKPIDTLLPIQEEVQKKNDIPQLYFSKGMKIQTQQSHIGEIFQSTYSPFLKKEVAICQIHKDFVSEGQKIAVMIKDQKDQHFTLWVRVTTRPFSYTQPDTNTFEKKMQMGLESYHRDELDKARQYFKEASEIIPDHCDPWEALAIISEKEGKIDEAIKLNQHFAKLNIEAPLARTNLSRLYMLKGWIEKAEEEKQKATVLMFKASAREKRLENENVKTTKQMEDEIANRKAIFRQVIEMDPNDEIANYGLGKLLFEEGQYQNAIELLRKVITINPNYSLAYSFLAKCLIKENLNDEAQVVLTTGIEKANQQGNMEPLKMMQKMLKTLYT